MKPITTLFTSLAAALLAIAPASVLAQGGAVSIGRLYQEGRTAFHRGDLETAKTKLAQVMAINPNLGQTRALLAQIEVLEAAQGGNPAMERKMGAILIDSIDLSEVTLQDAIEFLSLKTKAESKDDFKPNIVLKGVPSGDEAKKFNLKLENVPAAYALEAMGSQVGVKFVYEKYAIVGRMRAESTATAVPVAEGAGQ